MFTIDRSNTPIYSVVVSTEDSRGRWTTGQTSRGYTRLADAKRGAAEALARPFKKASRKHGYYTPATLAREVWVVKKQDGTSSKVPGTFAERFA